MAGDKIKTILVTGANGQLGSELRRLSTVYPQYHFLFTGSADLDIVDHAATEAYFTGHQIDVCINCAAYTAVDKAETERDRAEKINGDGPGNLAAACRKCGAKFFHISTDYVFNGKGSSPYLPGNATDPVNFYGSTKLHGEQNAMSENKDTVIIRTAWVYSSFGHNFVKTMIRLMREKESINVVADQVGSPTYAADLAAALMHIIDADHFVPGTYHYTNSGTASWFDFAKEIAALLDTGCKVNAISTDQFPTPAVRPKYSVLDTSSLTSVFGISIPQWQDSLKSCMALLK